LAAVIVSGCQFDSSGLEGQCDEGDCQSLPDASAPAVDGTSTDSANAVPEDWMDPAWGYRRRIVIDGGQLTATLVEFPVMIAIDDPALSTKVQQTGADIAFTAANGQTRLAHELEHFDSESGTLVAWVGMPSLVSGEDTSVYIYYGNPGAPDQSSGTDVWDASYHGVWHLGEDAVDEQQSTTHSDSSRGNFGAQAGNARVVGQVGFAQQFDGDDDEVSISNPDTFLLGDASCTVSAWIRTTSTDDMGIVIKSPVSSHVPNDKLFGVNHEPNKLGIDQGWVTYLGATTDVTDGAWHHVAWVQTADAANGYERWELYVDGEMETTKDAWTASDPASHTLRLGGYSPGSYFASPFAGDIDEVRISHTARGAAWIAASYANQAQPSTFYSLDSEQALDGQ
jgi:hypothetical protein